MPLYLSTLAGASTCLGAAVVFWHPQRHNIGPNTMSFSLALAGSVMITVSVLSLGPECLRDTTIPHSDPFQLMPLWSSMFLERIVSFGMGCLLYRLLSYFAFPDPEILVLELQQSDCDNKNRDREPCNGVMQDASIHRNSHDNVSPTKKQRQLVIGTKSKDVFATCCYRLVRQFRRRKGTTNNNKQPVLLLHNRYYYHKTYRFLP